MVLTTAFSSPLNKNLVPPLPVELTRYADPATICHGKIVGDCIRGDRNSKEKPILVLGDSHAAMLNYFFDVVGKELNLSFRVITASSCVTIPNFDSERLVDWAKKPCQEQIHKAKKYIAESERIILISMWALHFKSVKFKIALNDFLANYNDKNIIFFSDVPNFMHYSPEKSYRFSYLGLGGVQYLQLDNKVDFANNNLGEIAKKQSNIYYIELLPRKLFKDFPFYNHKPLYFDSHHLNEYGSKSLAKLTWLKMKSIYSYPKIL